MPEEILIKQKFTERLKTQQLERRRRLSEIELKEELERKRLRRLDREHRKEWLRTASLKYFLYKKFGYEERVRSLYGLPPEDLANAKKEALNHSIRQIYGSSLATFLILGLGAYEVFSLGSPLLALLTTIWLEPVPLIVFLRHTWFVIKGYYLRPYCGQCLHQRDTKMVDTYPHNNYYCY